MPAERRILPYLQAEGIGALAGLVLSSPAGHHAGGLATVLGGLPVARVVDGGTAPTPALFQAAQQACHLATPWEVVSFPGWRWPDGCRLQAWRTRRADGEDVLSLRWSLGRTSVLMVGDLDAAAAGQVAWPVSDVLVLPDHGRTEACPEAFLAAVRPRWAILEGAPRRWHRPKPELAALLARHQVRLWDTARQGALRLSLDGAGLDMRITAGSQWQKTAALPDDATAPH